MPQRSELLGLWSSEIREPLQNCMLSYLDLESLAALRSTSRRVSTCVFAAGTPCLLSSMWNSLVASQLRSKPRHLKTLLAPAFDQLQCKAGQSSTLLLAGLQHQEIHIRRARCPWMAQPESGISLMDYHIACCEASGSDLDKSIQIIELCLLSRLGTCMQDHEGPGG